MPGMFNKLRRGCAVMAVLSVLLFSARQGAWGMEQERIDDENIIGWGGDYSGSGAIVAGDLNLRFYTPWEPSNMLPRLETPASLRISDAYPKLDGATSAYPLYAAAANEVYAVDDKNKLEPYLACSRTDEAYDSLIRGEADIIFVLQPSDEQLNKAKAAGVELRFTPVAKDAFVFFVNSRNPVTGLSIEQIRGVYRKKITNWRELGGDNKKILPFQRPDNSGSQTAMIKEVMKGEQLPQALHEIVPSMKAALFSVARYRDYEESIGYSFRFFTEEMMRHYIPYEKKVIQWELERHQPEDEYRSFLQNRLGELKPVKLLAVDGIAPSVENIRSGAYPFTVDIFAVTAGTSNPHADDLIAWLLSPQGQELIGRAGYVGVAASGK